MKRTLTITAVVAALLLSSTPAQAATPKPNEGWISLVSRTCGSSSGWQTIAKANGSHGPQWILPLRSVTVHCPGKPSGGGSKPPAKPSAVKWLRPIVGGYCSSGFGPRGKSFHDGIDLAAARGTRIRASAAGTVTTSAYEAGGAGWYVKVTMPGGWWFMDMHMMRRPSVRVGQHVVQGQTLGYVGATGDASGPHVHLRVHHGSKAVNPATLGLGC